LISYELVISSAILILIFLTSSFNLTINVEYQRAAWFIGTLAPVFIIFYVAAIAETNRPPFDLAEAESELVSGFMTEHAAVVFVFFFLAEYGSMVLMCILLSILFLGGYLSVDFINLINNLLNRLNELLEFIFYLEESVRLLKSSLLGVIEYTLQHGFTFILSGFIKNSDALLENIGLFITIINNNLGPELIYSLILGFKGGILVFIFIWARASFPRIRFDTLMTYCWTEVLPTLFGIIILVPNTLGSFDIFPANAFFMISPLLKKVAENSAQGSRVEFNRRSNFINLNRSSATLKKISRVGATRGGGLLKKYKKGGTITLQAASGLMAVTASFIIGGTLVSTYSLGIDNTWFSITNYQFPSEVVSTINNISTSLSLSNLNNLGNFLSNYNNFTHEGFSPATLDTINRLSNLPNLFSSIPPVSGWLTPIMFVLNKFYVSILILVCLGVKARNFFEKIFKGLGTFVSNTISLINKFVGKIKSCNPYSSSKPGGCLVTAGDDPGKDKNYYKKGVEEIDLGLILRRIMSFMDLLPRYISTFNFEGIIDGVLDVMVSVNQLTRYVLDNPYRIRDQWYILMTLTYLSNTLPIVIEHLNNLIIRQEHGQLVAQFLTIFLEQVNMLRSLIIYRLFR
jgi:hypothetical protein